MSVTMENGLKNRWWITANLITTSNLRIGTGDSVKGDERVPTNEARTEFAQVSAVATDADGKPWIPGAGLRGALRAWLETRFKNDARITTLFGPPAGKAEKGNAGLLAVFAASFTDSQNVSGVTRQSDYWSDARVTTVETGVAIDRVFGVASDKKLYYREVVPAGVRFQWEMTVYGGDKNDVELLLAALEALGRGEIPLGADSQDGKGELRLENLGITLADAELQQQWIDARLKDSESRPLKALARPQTLTASQPIQPAPPSAALAITLNFESLFCVNDPGRVIKKNDPRGRDKTQDKMPRLDARGRPLLPAASFRGVLRTRMERIGRTLGLPICEGSGTACKAVHTLAEAAKLCPVCALMGAAGWASTLQLSDFTEESGRDLGDGMPQDFVAIDRFTGGGKDGAKFQFRAFHQPILSGRLTLDTDRLAKIGHAKDSIGLLKLALRDLEEGDLRFGMGAAKGYGQVREAGFSPIEGWSAIMTAVVGNSPQSEAPKFQPETPKEFKEPPKPTQEAGSNEFLNPYQFVPPPTRLPGGNAPPPEGWKNLSDAKAAKLGHAGHQCFVNQAGGEPVYSGRIICQLTAETPLFVGGLREPYQPAKDGQPERLAIAHHFKLGNQRSNGSDAEPDGDLAIPASSLRGLISSLVEAATGSAMRVLDDRMLSYRKSADEALSAIGMVVKARNPKTGEEVWCIRPMTMQTKQWLPKDKKWIDKPAGDYPSFDGSPARLKAYVDRDVHDAVLTGSYWYASFDPLLKWTGDGYSRPGAIRHPSKDTHGNVHIGQKANGDGTLGFKDLRQSALTKDTRCLFRTMRHPERLKSMVKEQKSGKAPAFAKHDLLLPWPEEGNKLPLLPIPPHVIERFNQLADERTELSLRQQGEKATDLTVLPYHPVGTKRNNDKTLGTKLRLKPGDLVYFHSMKDGGALKVDEISFSAIWRDRVEEKFEEDGKTVKKAATVRRFFEKVSAELLPFNKKRQFLSPAEMMFGYASDDKKERPEEEWGGAYAGRVFPGHGLTKNAVQGDEVPLKILDAPKPPSPSLYFRPAQGSGYIAKKGLNPNDHRPNGRKFYLHQTQKLGNWKASEQYAQEHKKQVVRIRPVKEGAEFVFHLDFENLSAWELGALCYALRPEEAFRHKLGMGKPLGLGTVCIDPLGVFLVDRPRRYTKASETGRRYHYTWLAKGAGAKLEEWQERYPREAQTSELPGSPTFDQLREKFRSGMEPNLRKALLVLGDPAYVGDTPVRYPVAQGQQDDSEQFQWFVNNDKAGHYWDRLPDGVLKGQFLEPPISGLNRLKPNKDFALKSKAKDKK